MLISPALPASQQPGARDHPLAAWRGRESAQRPLAALDPSQEELVIFLRTELLLPLDDLLVVVREFIQPCMNRSALDRVLRRRGHSRLPVPDRSTGNAWGLRGQQPGSVRIEVKELPRMAAERSSRHVFVATDRATRWVFIAIKRSTTAADLRSFLNAARRASPFKIKALATAGGTEIGDNLFNARGEDPIGRYEFDELCSSLGIEPPSKSCA